MIGVRGQERLRRTLPVPFPPFVGHVSDALRGERDGEEETAEQTGGLVLVRTRHPQMLRGGETRGQGLLPLCPRRRLVGALRPLIQSLVLGAVLTSPMGGGNEETRSW